jgi:hypothetical protein
MMKKMWAWMLLTLLTSVGQWYGHCHGCLEEERIGLLVIKALIDPNNVQWQLSDWMVNQEDIADCCGWCCYPIFDPCFNKFSEKFKNSEKH